MRLEFRKIILHNFMSFKDAEIELNDRGIVQVKGINTNASDCSMSNGSGKSTIGEAISWALTGECIRGGLKNIVSTFADDGTFVDIYFYADSDKFRIIRSKEHKEYKTSLQIFINDEDKSGKGIKDSEKLLETYLPDINSNILGSVVILGQGMPKRFSNNTPSGRKEVLESISKSDYMIEDLKNRVAIRKQSLENEKRSIDDTLLSVETKESMLNRELANAEKIINESFDANAILSEIEKNNNCINDYKSKQEVAKVELDNLQKKLNEENKVMNSYKDSIMPKIIEVSCDIEKAQFCKELNDLYIKRDGIKNEIKKIKSIVDVCPTCGQKIVGIEKPSTDELENSLSSIIEEIDRVSKEHNAHIKELVDKKTLLQKECDSTLATMYESINALEKNINSNRVNYDSNIDALIKLNTELQKKLDIHNTQIEIAKSNLSSYNNELSDLNDKKIVYTNKRTDNSNSLNAIKKMEVALTRDFRGHLLKNVIDCLNNSITKYSQSMFDSNAVKVALDGNNLNIYYNDLVYEALSGGERQKIDICVQFALRDMLCKFANFSCNILMLDEIMDNLDMMGSQRVLDMVTKNLSDLSSIFIISHHTDELQIPYDTIITIVKNESGISRLQ